MYKATQDFCRSPLPQSLCEDVIVLREEPEVCWCRRDGESLVNPSSLMILYQDPLQYRLESFTETVTNRALLLMILFWNPPLLQPSGAHALT